MKTLDHIGLKDKDRQAIEAAARLLYAKFPVERVVLFGSKAAGTDDAESDIDLLVLTSRALSWDERSALTDALFDIELAEGVVISTLVVPSREWSEGVYSVLPIHDEVARWGVAT
jgi:predicted nucleotidyltransferase